VLRTARDQADTKVVIAIVRGAETLRGRRLEVWVCLANRTPASFPPESAASTIAPVPSVSEGRPLHTTTTGKLLLLPSEIPHLSGGRVVHHQTILLAAGAYALPVAATTAVAVTTILAASRRPIRRRKVIVRVHSCGSSAVAWKCCSVTRPRALVRRDNNSKTPFLVIFVNAAKVPSGYFVGTALFVGESQPENPEPWFGNFREAFQTLFPPSLSRSLPEGLQDRILISWSHIANPSVESYTCKYHRNFFQFSVSNVGGVFGASKNRLLPKSVTKKQLRQTQKISVVNRFL